MRFLWSWPWCLLPVILAACDGSIGPASGGGAAGFPGVGGTGPGGVPVIPGSSVTPPPRGAPPGAAGPINPGRVVAHRLNKVEYDNTIRDLFGVDLKPSSQFGFPDDNYVEGFDNNALALTSSPLLLEKYEQAVAAVVTAALDPAPANQAVRAQVLLCDGAAGDSTGCAAKILGAFAERAFRRPVTPAELAPYTDFVSTAAGVGDGFEQGISAALQAMLLSPKFLFRVEQNPPPGQAAPLGAYELASRLSYFIWSSMPDAELFQRAADQSLLRPEEIARQVARMLADPKATALVDNLAGEWLASRELAVKDITLTGFTFDDALRDAMAREASLFLRELVVGDRPLMELLGADFVMVNRRLAEFYGFPGASSLGDAFQSMPVPGDRRGGVLTQANFLTVNSQRDRTSPTRRGKWISENLLCVVIPPPPPKIPELVPNSAAMPTSTRERLEAHRRKGSTCNGCHQYMDPLGLGFEHYDAVGRYRATDLGAAIDASGEIPVTNVPFTDAMTLTAALEADGRLADCIVRKFLTYALGRSLNLTPRPADAIDDVAAFGDLKARAAAQGDRLSALVRLIAQSPPMTMRVGEL